MNHHSKINNMSSPDGLSSVPFNWGGGAIVLGVSAVRY